MPVLPAWLLRPAAEIAGIVAGIVPDTVPGIGHSGVGSVVRTPAGTAVDTPPSVQWV